MIGHLADKILERLFGKAEHLTTRFGIEQLLPGSPEDLAGPLRSIQKPPLAGSLPQILIDHPRHAVGNLGKAIFSLTGALLRLLDPADIGQYCQHPQHIAIGIAIRAFGIDNMAGRTISSQVAPCPLQILSCLPHQTLFFQHTVSECLWHVLQLLTATASTEESIAIGLIAQGDPLLAIT